MKSQAQGEQKPPPTFTKITVYFPEDEPDFEGLTDRQIAVRVAAFGGGLVAGTLSSVVVTPILLPLEIALRFLF